MSDSIEPYFQIHAFVCTNQRDESDPRGSCAARGSNDLRDYLKKKAKMAGLLKGTRINNAGCLDRCELGPVMVVYPEGVWYAMDSKEDVDEIVAALAEGKHVDRLLLKPEDRQRSRPMKG